MQAIQITDGRTSLWQWDTGVRIKVYGCTDVDQMHFVTPGGIISRDLVDGECGVPDTALQTEGLLKMYAFDLTENGGVTRCDFLLMVKARPKPADYIDPPDEYDNLEELAKRVASLIPGGGGEPVTPEQIQKAVDNYLAENPVQVEETDPTVPGWAKAEQKPTYTAKEVGALPADAEIVDQTARDGVATLYAGIAKKDKPLVYIDGEIPVTKDNVLAEMRVVSGWLNFHAYIKIKCQGTSSMAYPKKNFTVTLYQDAARTIPLEITIPGWKHASNKFVLKANWIDHLHARNIISARLWSDVVASRPDYDTLPIQFRESPNNGAVAGFPIIVTTNGSYQGVYTWNIGKDAWLWGMDEDNPNHILLCAETNTDNEVIDTPCNFRTLWNGVNEQDWSVEVGENSESVKTALNALISCVKDMDDATFKATIGDHLDLRSAIDYWIFQYVICGIDGLAKNMLLGKYSEKKWICGAYDLDSTFGLWWTGASFVSAMTKCPEGYQEKRSLLWERISALYADEVKARYAELRESVLSYANITSLFEEFYKQVGRDAYADDLIPYPEIPSAETNNIWQIRNFVRDRLNYADKKIVGGVPEEYEQISYIDATGTQYIDTGVSGGTNASYEIKFSALSPQTKAYEQFFFGDNPPPIPGLFYSNDSMEAMGITSKDVGGVTKISTWDTHGRDRDVIVRYESDGNIYVDNALFTKRETSGNGWGESTWYVANSHGEPTLTAHMRIYYVKMWTDGVLVRDFVPAINTTSNAAGLYDRVTGEFFVNAGTGEFVTPA